MNDAGPNAAAPATTTAATWRYGPFAVTLHWAIAALIVFLVGLGWYMMSVEKEPGSAPLFDLHKSLGITVCALIVLRLAWRATHRPEGLPDSVPRWQTWASAWLHGALYVVTVALPITGYWGASHQKHPPTFFGLPTPVWTTPDHDLAERLFTIHSVLAWLLVGLVALHVVAGLKHLLIDRDRVFQRMWPGRARR